MAAGIRGILSRLDRFGRLLENASIVALLCAMMLVAITPIVLRVFFNSGVLWASELLKLMVLWLAMIAAIAASRDNRHIRIDALSHLLPETAIRVTRVVVDVFAAIVCGVLAWQSYRYLQIEIEFEDTVFFDTPAWAVHVIVPVAFVLLSYRFLIGAIKSGLGMDSIADSERLL